MSPFQAVIRETPSILSDFMPARPRWRHPPPMNRS
jgi:hypothetical protein